MTTDYDQQGLYVPQLEKDACGIGMLANLENIDSHDIVSDGLVMLENMEHRGATGFDPDSGDGAGILIHVPHKLFASEELGFALPQKGEYGVANVFFPKSHDVDEVIEIISECADQLEIEYLGRRDVPIDSSILGADSSATEPHIFQLFFRSKEGLIGKDFDRKLFLLRKFGTHYPVKQIPTLKDDLYFCSLSSRTIIYKGQLSSMQVRKYYHDLQNPLCTSAVSIVHSRFSTNTIPKWRLAQPFRMIAHNGEINTIEGNKNWWSAREPLFESEVISKQELKKILPLFNPTSSDSAIFDNIVEFLAYNGRTLPHAMMMMIPEAWQNATHFEDYKRAFYEYHEGLMEPWDGPASMCFTDGTLIGGTLDRNGLRPSRYCLTDDNRLILASETGVLPIDPAKIVFKGRLEPGKILIADLDLKKVIGDEELKSVICQRLPYQDWIKESKVHIDDLPQGTARGKAESEKLSTRQTAQGYTREDVDLIISSMITNKKEPVGSMGADIPLAVLSQHAQHISTYFRQQFAQVTNPPIDSLRESEYMSLQTVLGTTSNLLNVKENTLQCIHLDAPVIGRSNFLKLASLKTKKFSSARVNCTIEMPFYPGQFHRRIEEITEEVASHINMENNLIILDNTRISENRMAIPSLIVTGAVHHSLVKKGLRPLASILVKGGDIIETHHTATLLGYGADVVHPSLACETITDLFEKGKLEGIESAEYAIDAYLKAQKKGLLKIMSKLGVSTVQSYRGAQTFEALGLSKEVVDLCFTGTVSRIGGLTFDMLAKEARAKHHAAYDPQQDDELIDIGTYQWKRRGEYHLFNPTTIHLLQNSTRKNQYAVYKKYAQAINDQAYNHCTLRSLFEIRKDITPIPITEVEPESEIMKRFATGAMSFGSISHEAHSTLAIAMNRIGGKSNSGEGGEDERRFEKKENGDWERSAIKQVASGRFGVTINYLTNANEIQIKMAQGAKPGEGGQLPGHKVNDWIARTRHSTPGVGLISPPPHHDIYSIEDLAQLIYDLKNANRNARISVKLVSKAGVGIIASGVTKGKADHILIAGHDGGTGASPLSSLRYAGLPWELGLAETHQTLMKNRIRDRVVLQADGQMRTGRDMAIATMLGAEEWGIATAALVVEGCILMRKCHLNTCPVGIATQDPDLRKKFSGKVDELVNFFNFLARDLREIMAQLGVRTVNELVGRSDLLKLKEDVQHWKAKSVDLSPIIYQNFVCDGQDQYCKTKQDHQLEEVLDRKLIESASAALAGKGASVQSFELVSTNRSVGTMLSHEIAKKYGSGGLEEDAISFNFTGSAGQSFGAFGAKGLTLNLEGDSNDYFGKGLSGAKLILKKDPASPYAAHENIIVGNVALYGATSGEAFINGVAGERFAVRNSGATAVVEGVGAHGCEYMTGGKVIILGDIGRNFAAGMSGGIAYILDAHHDISVKLNMEMIEVEALGSTDIDFLKTIIERHQQYTGSKRAAEILENWDTIQQQFVKIMPTEYKRALAERARKERPERA